MTETIGAGVTPVPLSSAVWGLPGALSATLKAATRGPAVPGVNVTLIAQFEPAGSELGQSFACEKLPLPAPVMETPLMLRAAVPVL